MIFDPITQPDEANWSQDHHCDVVSDVTTMGCFSLMTQHWDMYIFIIGQSEIKISTEHEIMAYIQSYSIQTYQINSFIV